MTHPSTPPTNAHPNRVQVELLARACRKAQKLFCAGGRWVGGVKHIPDTRSGSDLCSAQRTGASPEASLATKPIEMQVLAAEVLRQR
jgi:hypothetical protein